MEQNETVISLTDREIISTRVLNAPRALVFKVWTEPEHIIQWWGPDGFTNTNKEMNVQPGGRWLFTMHGPNGIDYPNKIEYQEVIVPEKLVYIHSGDDNPDDPHIFHVTVTFEENGDQTILTMRMLFGTPEELDKVVKEFGAGEGNKQTLAKLAAYLETISK